MRILNVATLLAALWSSVVLFDWATISDPHSEASSLTLTGSELSQTLTLLPAIVILISLIARYRKMPKQIMFFAAATAIWAGYLGFTLNPAATPAAISGLELLTGISGVIGSQQLTFAPTAYSLLALVVAGFFTAAALGNRKSSKPEAVVASDEPTDPRSIWDSQN